MADFYIKYYDLISDDNVKNLVNSVELHDNNQCDMMTSKHNIEDMCDENENLLQETRIKILKYMYFVWIEGIVNGNAPADFWCEMMHNVKKLVVVTTILESLNSKESRIGSMDISLVLIKLWDYITTQERNDNWNYIIEEYDSLVRKHNDLRELYFM